MDSSFTLRRASATDTRRLYAISIAAHRSGYGDFIPSIRRNDFTSRYTPSEAGYERFSQRIAPYFGTGDSECMVVEAAEIIGYALFKHSDNGSGWLSGLFIDPASQGIGVGRALLTDLVQRYGHREMSLRVIEANHRARGLYEVFNFRITPAEQAYYFGAEEILMVRPLTNWATL